MDVLKLWRLDILKKDCTLTAGDKSIEDRNRGNDKGRWFLTDRCESWAASVHDDLSVVAPASFDNPKSWLPGAIRHALGTERGPNGMARGPNTM